MKLKAKWEDLRTREAWLAWQAIAKKKAPDCYEYWTSSMHEGCEGCIHADFDAVWCKLQELPATRNPYLGCLGMACMGMGKETMGQQEIQFL